MFIGFFGDALDPSKGDCKPCDCYHLGTIETGFGPLACDQLSGQCQCKPHITGVNCDQCEVGHFNIASGDVNYTCSLVLNRTLITVMYHFLGLSIVRV